MRRIPLFDYVALNNPNGGAKVLKHFNLPVPSSKKEIARGLRYVMINFEEDGIRKIAEAHPDRDLILDTQEAVVVEEPKEIEKTPECGCHSNANGVIGNPVVANQELIDAIKEGATKEETKLVGKEKTNELTKDDVASEVKRVLNQSNPFIKDTLPYLAIGGLGLFLFYTAVKSK